MHALPDIASVARLMADPSRATILLRLLDGRALTATELATRANISPQTASSHLGQLCAGELLTVDRQGRHRYFRLASPAVAQVIESLMTIAPNRNAQDGPSARGAAPARADFFARTCYDHLAGKLGVLLTDALIERGWLVAEAKDYRVGPVGVEGFRALGIELEELRKQRRQFARQCLDWSERRHHLAGALGAALARTLFERKWLLKAGAGRAAHVTEGGRRALEETFGVRL
jgi:DNA-binding transcriptional ArsR family regulator